MVSLGCCCLDKSLLLRGPALVVSAGEILDLGRGNHFFDLGGGNALIEKLIEEILIQFVYLDLFTDPVGQKSTVGNGQTVDAFIARTEQLFSI